MKAYKLKETTNGLSEGRIFIPYDSQTILSGNYSEPMLFYPTYSFERLKQKDLFIEIDLADEKWIHPHLYKPIKQLLQN